MSWLRLTEIASMTQGVLHGNDTAVNGISIDSRKVQRGDLFLAIRGENHDAHDYVCKLQGKACGALVSHRLECDIPQVLVKDTRLALVALAKAWRSRYRKPLIGLTGSNGKTTLKEMIAAILSRQLNVLATLGNFNNDIGMPLTLLRIRDTHDVAVIEMGANHFGEIAMLTDIARPDIAIINNAGPAHLEGFGDIQGVARAKGEIFQGLAAQGTAVINADDTYADYWAGLINEGQSIIRFGLDQPADVQGVYQGNGQLLIRTEEGEQSLQLQLLGRHNAMNALAATAVTRALGVNLATVKEGLESLSSVPGRLSMVTGLRGSLLIDDTYNANPASVDAALGVLAEAPGVRLMVLGDMGELGENSAALHAETGMTAKRLGIDRLYCLGRHSTGACVQFGSPETAYVERDALINALKQEVDSDMTILIKGSRSARMEYVVEALKAHETSRSEPC